MIGCFIANALLGRSNWIIYFLGIGMNIRPKENLKGGGREQRKFIHFFFQTFRKVFNNINEMETTYSFTSVKTGQTRHLSLTPSFFHILQTPTTQPLPQQLDKKRHSMWKLVTTPLVLKTKLRKAMSKSGLRTHTPQKKPNPFYSY